MCNIEKQITQSKTMKLIDPSALKRSAQAKSQAANAAIKSGSSLTESQQIFQMFDAREVIRSLGMSLAVTAMSAEQKKAYTKAWIIWAMGGGLLQNRGRRGADGGIQPLKPGEGVQTQSLWILSTRLHEGGNYWRSKLINYKEQPFAYIGDMALVMRVIREYLQSMGTDYIALEGCEFPDICAYIQNLPDYAKGANLAILYTTNGQCNQLVKSRSHSTVETIRISLRSNAGLRVIGATEVAAWLMSQLEKKAHLSKAKFFDDLEYQRCIDNPAMFMARWGYIKTVGIRAYKESPDVPHVLLLTSYGDYPECPLSDPVRAYEIDVWMTDSIRALNTRRLPSTPIAGEYLVGTGTPMPIDFVKMPTKYGVF